MIRKKIAVFLSLSSVFLSLHAEGESDIAADKKPVGIDFFTRVYSISNLKEKDGNIFFILGKPDRETDTYPRDLYQLVDGQAIRLTRSGNVSDYFFWEDDLVFRHIGDPKDREKVRRGEPLTVFQKLSPTGFQESAEWLRLPFFAGQILWIDKEHFFYTSSYDHHFQLLLKESNGDVREARKKREENKRFRVFDEYPFWINGRGDISGLRTHLYYYDRGKRTLLTDTLGSSSGFELSPDRKTLIYTDREAYYGKAPGGAGRLIALDVETLTKKEIQLPEKSTGGGVQFLNSDEILLTVRSAGPQKGKDLSGICRLHLKTGELTRIYDGKLYSVGNSIGSDIGGGGGAKITSDGEGIRFVTTHIDHAPLIHVSYGDAKVTFLTKAGATIQEYLPYKDGFLAVAQVEQQGSEICFIDRNGSLSPLSSVNKPVFDAHHVVKPVEVTFVNEDGRTLNGFVLPPVNRQKGKKYPGILDIHGGPRSAYGTVFFHEMQYWASQGYAVLFTNPTGSTGRGVEFTDIKGKWGAVDYRDLMAFVDAALQQIDFIDGNRLGVTGGSYGGFMTNWIIGHTDRFKAAASQRGMSSWFSVAIGGNAHDYAFSNIGTDAWTNSDLFWEQSPLKYADRVKTPTLFIHTEEDYTAPMWEGIQMYSALRYFNVPARMVLFKDENHSLSRSGKPVNRIKRLAEITGWFDTWLKQ
ncbi:MAG: S9 family peptidase [Tannerella sp.]|jgi:dipeptidyl aminopeptidase/acylaminoacyl peptidase|nr:S9 family peptidase [Tannerella sp.]